MSLSSSPHIYIYIFNKYNIRQEQLTRISTLTVTPGRLVTGLCPGSSHTWGTRRQCIGPLKLSVCRALLVVIGVVGGVAFSGECGSTPYSVWWFVRGKRACHHSVGSLVPRRQVIFLKFRQFNTGIYPISHCLINETILFA